MVMCIGFAVAQSSKPLWSWHFILAAASCLKTGSYFLLVLWSHSWFCKGKLKVMTIGSEWNMVRLLIASYSERLNDAIRKLVLLWIWSWCYHCTCAALPQRCFRCNSDIIGIATPCEKNQFWSWYLSCCISMTPSNSDIMWLTDFGWFWLPG